jgi:hypothetical protein
VDRFGVPRGGTCTASKGLAAFAPPSFFDKAAHTFKQRAADAYSACVQAAIG